MPYSSTTRYNLFILFYLNIRVSFLQISGSYRKYLGRTTREDDRRRDGFRWAETAEAEVDQRSNRWPSDGRDRRNENRSSEMRKMPKVQLYIQSSADPKRRRTYDNVRVLQWMRPSMEILLKLWKEFRRRIFFIHQKGASTPIVPFPGPHRHYEHYHGKLIRCTSTMLWNVGDISVMKKFILRCWMKWLWAIYLIEFNSDPSPTLVHR